MKKECEYTRKSLRRYLRGHLFRPEQIKIERHLNKCVLCRTEFQALKRAAETQKLIKDITPPEGVVQKVKAGMSGLSMLKKVIYRPLWVVAFAAFAAAIYFFVISPIHRISEHEAMSIPSGSAPAPVASAPSGVPPVSVPSATPPAPIAASPVPGIQPPKPADTAVRSSAQNTTEQRAVSVVPARIQRLKVTVTAADEQAAIKKINEVLQEHASLNTLRMTDTNKEVSGSLISSELLTLFDRLRAVGKVRYSKSGLDAFSSQESVPFSLTLKTAPKSAERPAEQQRADKPAPISDGKPVENPAPEGAPR